MIQPSEVHVPPLWNRTNNYRRKPFIWWILGTSPTKRIPIPIATISTISPRMVASKNLRWRHGFPTNATGRRIRIRSVPNDISCVINCNRTRHHGTNRRRSMWPINSNNERTHPFHLSLAIGLGCLHNRMIMPLITMLISLSVHRSTHGLSISVSSFLFAFVCACVSEWVKTKGKKYNNQNSNRQYWELLKFSNSKKEKWIDQTRSLISLSIHSWGFHFILLVFCLFAFWDWWLHDDQI